MEKHKANQIQQAWEDVGEQLDILIQHSEHFAELLRRNGEETMSTKLQWYFINTLTGFQQNQLQVTASEIQDCVDDLVTEILHTEK